MSGFLNNKNSKENEEHWVSLADLMAGLLMVFIMIAVAYMHSASLDKREAERQQVIAENQREIAEKQQALAEIQRDKIRRVAITYQQNKKAIYDALLEEFKTDLPIWNADINKDNLTFNFKSPEVLFAVGSSEIRDGFQKILDDFFPRYMNIIGIYIDSVEEIRIEGHTDSHWGGETSATKAYFLNMELSQDRTRSVLDYIYRLPQTKTQQKWIKGHIAAVGYSSAKPIMVNGVENAERSRRVAFRVVTNSEQQILKILTE